jgi:solute carrier family 35 protein E3
MNLASTTIPAFTEKSQEEPLASTVISGLKDTCDTEKLSGEVTVVGKRQRSIEWKVVPICLFNACCTICIVGANKVVFDRYDFRFGTSLTFIHFAVTGLGLYLMALLRFFRPVRLDLRKTCLLAAFGMGFVVLTNLSLLHNSVAFYQLFKHMNTVGVIALEWWLHRKPLPANLRVPILLLIIGVIVNTFGDYRFNILGTFYAVAAVFVTSFYQLWAGRFQHDLRCDPLQLQFYTAPLSAVFLVPFLPVFDEYRWWKQSSIWEFPLTVRSLGAILLSGLIAMLMNISIFMTIGSTSALTYNVLGHAKTTALLLMDFAVYGRPLNLQNTFGVMIALGGVFLYTYAKIFG